MKKLLTILMCLVTAVLFAAPGTIHLLYNNGQLTESEGNMYYEFDIQAYLSEGTQVLGSGMAYVEYPTAVFGDLAITNNIVNVTKVGILDGLIPDVSVYLYDVFENDTYANVFAITFEATTAGNADLKYLYSEISVDPEVPSDLLHVSMKAANYGSGNVMFPSYIPSIDYLYYNYEIENFAGGLDISEAVEPVLYEDPIPDPVGTIEWKSFTAGWKKNVIELKWSTKSEIDIVGFVIKRSTNGEEPVEIASYLTDPSLIAVGAAVSKYEFNDENVMASNSYSYMIEAIDIVGAAIPSNPVDVLNEAIVEESYPNPFNPDFVVPFELYSTNNVNIKLYDMTGRMVKSITSGEHAAGRYEYRVNCENLTSGVYLLRTVINDNATTQKMLLVK